MSRIEETNSLWQEYDEIDIADVVVEVDAPDLLPTYSYSVPADLRADVDVGACVHVPFGGQDKLGYVLARRKLPLSDPLARRLRSPRLYRRHCGRFRRHVRMLGAHHSGPPAAGEISAAMRPVATPSRRWE